MLAGVTLFAGCGDGTGRPGTPFEPGGDGTTTGIETSSTGNDDMDDGGSTFGGDSIGGDTEGPDTGDSADDTGDDDSTGSNSTGVENDCPWAQVDVGAGTTLNVRPDPSTAGAPVGSLSHGTIVEVIGEAFGEGVDGNDLWYEIETATVTGWISAAFAVCTTEEPPEINPNGWYLPLECGTTATVSQGNFGATSHTGTSAYAFDFAVPLGTPLVAIADGTVTQIFDETGPGDPCYNGGDSSCSGFANYVVLLHADDTKSLYMHLQEVSVGIGDVVGIGQTVGLSGSTGWSTGRHAHVMRMENCAGYYCQSIDLAFNDVAGDGVPESGDMVTSGNCP